MLRRTVKMFDVRAKLAPLIALINISTRLALQACVGKVSSADLSSGAVRGLSLYTVGFALATQTWPRQFLSPAWAVVFVAHTVAGASFFGVLASRLSDVGTHNDAEVHALLVACLSVCMINTLLPESSLVTVFSDSQFAIGHAICRDRPGKSSSDIACFALSALLPPSVLSDWLAALAHSLLRFACRSCLQMVACGRAPACSPCCSSPWGDAHVRLSCLFYLRLFFVFSALVPRMRYSVSPSVLAVCPHIFFVCPFRTCATIAVACNMRASSKRCCPALGCCLPYWPCFRHCCRSVRPPLRC